MKHAYFDSKGEGGVLRRPRRRRLYYINELDRYYDPSPDPFPFIPLIIVLAMGAGITFGGVWFLKELKEPPEWLSDWKKFAGSPIGLVALAMLALGFLMVLGYLAEKFKGRQDMKAVLQPLESIGE